MQSLVSKMACGWRAARRFFWTRRSAGLESNSMPERSSKAEDVNLPAADTARQATGENHEARPMKNPAAVALGRLGGLKGGKARAAKLSAERRRQIAKKAARARWENREGEIP